MNSETKSAQPSPAGQGDALPALPKPGFVTGGDFGHEGHNAFTPEQMRDYARAALAARQPVAAAVKDSLTVGGGQPVGQENPLMPYVDSYRRMAKIGSGRVSCTAVADDIERNMAPHAAPPAQAVEMSPEFTDTARAAIAWVLWHHQGGSSPVGQPLRFALGMGQHDRMTDHQIAEAKRFAAWANATTEDFHQRAPAQAVDLGQFKDLYRAYVRLLESGRDRIRDLGGTCDRVDVMEANDVDLQAARRVIDIKAVGK